MSRAPSSSCSVKTRRKAVGIPRTVITTSALRASAITRFVLSLNCVALLNTIGMARLPGVLPSHDASIPNRSRFSRQTTYARYVSL
jgi:hypothetical protein